jgi:hypothetical protein
MSAILASAFIASEPRDRRAALVAPPGRVEERRALKSRFWPLAESQIPLLY